jgi:Ger(x)C family germination protein
MVATVVTIAACALTGCWDSVELEERAFVNAVGADMKDGERAAALSVSSLDALIGEKSEDKSGDSVKKGFGASFTAALREADGMSSKRAYFGHTKVIVFGENLLRDQEAFSEALDALERDNEISDKLLTVATDGEASEILEKNAPGEPSAGLFATYFYKNKRSSLKLDLATLSRRLHENGCALIPKIETRDKQLKLSGAAVISNGELVGWMDEKNLSGLAWISGERGALINIPSGVVLSVSKIKNKLKFYDKDNGVTCVAEINVTGEIVEDNNGQLQRREIEKLCEDEINKQTLNSFLAFKELKADGFRLAEAIRKFEPSIYERYDGDETALFDAMDLEPRATVSISGTGSIG